MRLLSFVNLKRNLSWQITMGYILILAVTIVASLLCSITFQRNQKLDNSIRESYLPLYLLLKDIQTVQINARRLSNNWVYQPGVEEKQQLKAIHDTEYPILKKNMEGILATYEGNAGDIREILNDFGIVLQAQKELMGTLPDDDAYADDKAVDKAISILKESITPQDEALTEKLETGIQNHETKMSLVQTDKEHSYVFLTVVFAFMILLFIIISVASYFYSRKKIVQPIIRLKDTVTQMSLGKTTEVKFEKRKDEIGLMTHAITGLMKGINERSNFAIQIGKGNYNEELKLLGSDDETGKALLYMRENLYRNAQEDQRRNWAATGLAKFAEMSRNQDNIQVFCNTIISNLVKYTSSNQGGLFIINDENPDDLHLRLLSCYAWERKKFIQKHIYKGEGLAGQCWEEGDPLFITDVPENYINITSGVGQALPRCVFVVPLKANGAIYGILELATFRPYETYQQEFIIKVCENMAAAIATVKTAEQTNYLLQQARQQTWQLRSQEEEMRQNMEELMAAREETERVLTDTQTKERFISEVMDSFRDEVVTVDLNYIVLSANKACERSFGANGVHFTKGFNMLDLARPGQMEEFKIPYQKAFAGEIAEAFRTYFDREYKMTYAPIRDMNNEIFGVCVMGHDINDLMVAKKNAEKLLQESEITNKELERSNSMLENQKRMIERALEKVKQKEIEILTKDRSLTDIRMANFRANASQLSAAIKTCIDTALDSARTCSHAFAAFVQAPSLFSDARAQANLMLQQVLKNNPAFLATFTLWEPDRFDNKDALYINQPGHDATGRFIPYWTLNEGKFIPEPLINYLQEGTGDYYLIPKKTNNEAVIDPYIYPVQGKDTWIMSAVAPVMSEGLFHGICGIDFAIGRLMEIVDKVPWKEENIDIAVIACNKNIVKASGSETLTGEHCSCFLPEKIIPPEGWSQPYEVAAEGNTYLFEPIRFGNTSTPWTVCVKIPDSKTMNN